jgi:hypothetical protein
MGLLGTTLHSTSPGPLPSPLANRVTPRAPPPTRTPSPLACASSEAPQTPCAVSAHECSQLEAHGAAKALAASSPLVWAESGARRSHSP